MSKKILFEAISATNPKPTGIGYYLYNLFINLKPNKSFKYYFFYFDFLNRDKKSYSFPGKNIVIRFMPGKLISVFNKLNVKTNINLFIYRKFDFIFFTNYVAMKSIYKTKYGLFVYDLGFLDCPEYVNDKNLKYLNKFCPESIINAILIVTISKFTQSRIKHHFPNLSVPIIVTPIPAPDNHAKDITKPIFNLSAKKFILFVGTIEPRKNLLNLIEAYTLLPKEIRDEYPLILAGSSGWKNENIYSRIKELKNKNYKIITTGYIDDSQKKWLYKNCSLFVMPSHYEGFGMPILEAMQYDAKIAASNIEVFKEIAGSKIEYFDQNNPESIAVCIKNSINTQPKDYTKILESMSWEKNIYKIINVLDNIIN